jgi:phosphatidylinositol kinase/protein kinase (PI-3  family)
MWKSPSTPAVERAPASADAAAHGGNRAPIRSMATVDVSSPHPDGVQPYAATTTSVRAGADAPKLASTTGSSRAHADITQTAPADPECPDQETGQVLLDRIFGASWEAKTQRVQRASRYGRQPGWSLMALITKANDDVRQEVFIMQAIAFFASIFPAPLRLRPYRILATGPASGLIELVADTLSLDSFKRRSGFPTLRRYFEAAYGGADSTSFASAQHNFACSLAAYSVVSYVLAIKDRHNGNILLDREGNLVHIDFGFVLGRAPGGVASLEAAVPFKLTREMVDVLGGANAPLFTETFVELCTTALRAVREHADTLLGLTEVSMLAPSLPCFAGLGRTPLEQLRQRLMLDLPDELLRDQVRRLVFLSYDNINTHLYDRFQKMSNGIEM